MGCCRKVSAISPWHRAHATSPMNFTLGLAFFQGDCGHAAAWRARAAAGLAGTWRAVQIVQMMARATAKSEQQTATVGARRPIFDGRVSCRWLASTDTSLVAWRKPPAGTQTSLSYEASFGIPSADGHGDSRTEPLPIDVAGDWMAPTVGMSVCSPRYTLGAERRSSEPSLTLDSLTRRLALPKSRRAI
jgi:hypothetical protein